MLKVLTSPEIGNMKNISDQTMPPYFIFGHHTIEKMENKQRGGAGKGEDDM